MNASSCYVDVLETGRLTRARFVTNRLDDNNLPEVSRVLADLVSQPDLTEMHLDFGKVESLSSAVLGKIVGTHQRMAKNGRRLLLLGVTGFVREVFTITRVDTMLNLRPDHPEQRLCTRASA
jgi:anti-anti-sigma factor